MSQLPDLARRGGGRRAFKICPASEAERELEELAKLGGAAIWLGEGSYPETLSALEDAPPVLQIIGRRELLERPAVAIVGARNASANARRFAENLARGLGDRGFFVVSGMARGIDAAAHRGALDSGTAAVMAGGVDVIYPPQNDDLYAAIREQGCLLSEIPLGTQPQARHFPRRNRLISGLSRGVVVVEAALRSGSLITARFAADQGREVMAVPGSPLDPRAKGTNSLLKQGATLIESVEDVADAIAAARPLGFTMAPSDRFTLEAAAGEAGETAAENDRAKVAVLEMLGPAPLAVDELVRRCHLSPAVVSVVLLELELAGRLERHPGARVSLLMEAPMEGTSDAVG